MMGSADRDFKYYIQDVQKAYFGAKLSYGELAEDVEIPFKFRRIVQRILLDIVAPETTLESHLYYLTREDEAFEVYSQLNASVRCNLRRENGTYHDKVYRIRDLAAITPEEKQAQGLIVRELILSKLALFAFTV